jgi:hypothetical protein
MRRALRSPSSRTLLALAASAYWGGLAFLRFAPFERTAGMLLVLVPLWIVCLFLVLWRLRRVGLPIAGVVPFWLWYDPLICWLVLWPGIEWLFLTTGPWRTDLPFHAFLALAEAWLLVAPAAFSALVLLPESGRRCLRPARCATSPLQRPA